jgi:hypothetical protein
MPATTMLLLNVFLALATTGTLAAVMLRSLRLRHAERAETLHPSQPLPLRLISREDEERELSGAA